VREIRRHPTVRKITIVQPDRIVQEMLNHFAALEPDSVVKVTIGDPLHYLGKLSRIGGHYDVVLLNIPLPVNAQWNRFYTREFLATVQRCIGEDGLLMLNFPGDEEFLTTAQVEFLKTMQNTARQVFQETTWIPD
jgi:spermidine synthase